MSKILKLFMMLLLVSACSKKDNREELTITDNEGNTVVYTVELAQSKEELTTGLMNRTELSADAGMIFDLSPYSEVPTAMWMKDTPLALDMIFIDKDGMIYWVYENAEPNSEQLIIAPYSATAVLEVNAGDIKAKGIKIGDMVNYKLFTQKKALEEVQSKEISEPKASEMSTLPQEEVVVEKSQENVDKESSEIAEDDVKTVDEEQISGVSETDTEKNSDNIENKAE